MVMPGGIAEYRGANYAGATELFTRLRPINDQDQTANHLLQVFRAMTHRQLNQHEEAQRLVGVVREKLYTKFSQVGRGIPFANNGGDHWFDWLIPAAVYPEAVHLIEGTDPAAVRADLTTLLRSRSGDPAAALSVLSKALERAPTSVLLLRERGNLQGQKSRWKEAARDFQEVVKRNSSDSLSSMVLAFLLRETNLPAYQKHCRKMRREFNDSAKWKDSGRMIAACLMHADVGEDWQALARQAENVVRGCNDAELLPWFQVAAGLACYRAGRPDEALYHLEWARGPSKFEIASGKAFFVLALCHARLKRMDEAQKCLDLGRKALSQHFPEGDKGNLPPLEWHEWLASDLLRREAKATLKP
jgi:tetratricopeptide (TPR) repeat protein